VDLDGDADLDLVAASAMDNTIAWFENLGGGSFGPRIPIATDCEGAISVYTADLNGDGFEEIIAGSFIDDTVAWWRNFGGGTFGPKQVITTEADGVLSIFPTDVDGDFRVDVLVASSWDDRLAWYKNLGGGSFDAPAYIATDLDGPGSAYTADLDNDGDADVIALGRADNRVAWFENLGGGAFSGANVISDEALNGRAVFAADLDGDLDIDVISASAGDNKIAWYQNLLNQLDCNANGISDAIERELDPTLDLDADGILDECEVIGTSYCSDGLENSIGASANIGMLGSPKVAEADLSITARDLPPHSAGFFFVSRTRVFHPFPPNCQGVLCVGGSIGRGVGGGILTSGAAGTFSGTVDLAAMTQPTGPVAVQPGETWYFQAWYRDMNPTITSNLTDAVFVTFQ